MSKGSIVLIPSLFNPQAQGMGILYTPSIAPPAGLRRTSSQELRRWPALVMLTTRVAMEARTPPHGQVGKEEVANLVDAELTLEAIGR
jgi:hypothetical protein